MKKNFGIGSLGEFMGRPFVLSLFLVQFVAVVVFAAYYHGRDTSDSCLYCHADKARMTASGYPQFYMTKEQVEKESRMPGVTCRDCHLGDGRAREADAAHRGMPRMMVLDNDAHVVTRKGRLDRLVPTGNNRMYALMPKLDDGETPDPEVFTVLWHDRDPKTLGYDPDIARKTCGKSGCHPAEVRQFDKTVMGGNVRQRATRHWLDVHGPNNCGPSFADLPSSGGAAAGYSEDNYKIIRGNLSCPSTFEDATGRQRFCNVCHAGCMDCHYQPNEKTGVHTFTRRVPSTNCAGGGRGTGMCHTGTQERRRGDTYLGAEFSQPPGMEPDPHVKAGLECVDCHETGEGGMGDIQRRVDCEGCHYTVTKAHEKGVHRRLHCQACHVGRLGGYEMTVWGEGHVGGRPSPFKKYSLYYGVMEPPILMKDREGLYAPYKAWPNIATNIKEDAKKHEGVEFRWPGGETRDAYAFLGTYGNLPGANKALAWIQLEAVGHPLGKSRTCRSCHGSAIQKSHANWEYLTQAGSEPFTGEQDIVADARGLRIKNIRKTSEPVLMGDANLYDFAAWMYLGDIWDVNGDFSIPRSDPKKYADYEKAEAVFKAKLAVMETSLKKLDPKSDGYKALDREVKKIREAGEHDPDAGLAKLP